MRWKWWSIPLAAAIVFALFAGVRSWQTERNIARVVDQFALALRDGRVHQAVALLAPEQADEARRSIAGRPWRPSPVLTHRLQRLHVDGETATADVWLIEGKFRLKPTLRLRRLGDAWKITSIDGLPGDRDTAASLAAQNPDETLANELGKVLEGRPGVLVEREENDRDRPR